MTHIQEFLKSIKSLSSDIPKVIRDLKKSNREIILFPAGTVAKGFFRTLDKNGVSISFFGDNNPAKVGILLYDRPVLSFEEICDKHKDSIIIVSSRNLRSEITAQFMKNGFDESDIVYRDFSSWNVHANSELYDTLRKAPTRFERVYDLCEDKLSQQTFLAKLKYLHDFAPETLEKITSHKTMYFDNDIVRLSENEFFVDGGAFTGDTFMDFRRHIPTFNAYYAFEPEEENFNTLKENIKGISNVYAINKGLWSKETTLGIFSQAGGSALIDDIEETQLYADETVPVTCIDTVCADVPITFIKMDIEGAEMEALKGAQNTIKQCRPKLAICIYHKPMDIVDLPIYMHELMPDAKMYIRHYGIGGTDTVCYLIPKKRN